MFSKNLKKIKKKLRRWELKNYNRYYNKDKNKRENYKLRYKIYKERVVLMNRLKIKH